MSRSQRAGADPNLVHFGLRLRQLRVGRELTQERLADQAGLHRTVIGFIERGEREIGVSKLWMLADALKVPVTELFDFSSL